MQNSITIPLPECSFDYTIAFLNIEKISKYSRSEVRRNVNDRYYLDIHFKNFNPYSSYELSKFDKHSLGNLAWLALHCPFSEITQKCYEALGAYQMYLYNAGICV